MTSPISATGARSSSATSSGAPSNSRYAVTHVMNITDVEDKSSSASACLAKWNDGGGKQNLAPRIHRPIRGRVLEDLKTLNCLLPHHTPTPPNTSPTFIALIEKLIARGIAIKPPTARFISASRIPRLRLHLRPVAQAQLRRNADRRTRQERRIRQGIRRRFSLWKARAPEDGDVFWKSESLAKPSRLAHRMFRHEHEGAWRKFYLHLAART